MPGGKPLYTYLDEGAKLEPDLAEGRRDGAVVVFNHNKLEVRCKLDPDHDWLPRQITMSSGAMDLIVERFGRDSGRWFPLSGTNALFPKAGGRKSIFKIDHLALNRPLPDSLFAMPPLTPGVIVSDETTHKGEIVGGLEARKALDARVPRTTSKAPLTAAREPESLPWSWGIAGVAALILILVGFLVRRNRTPG